MPDSVTLPEQSANSIEGSIDRVDGNTMQLWCRDTALPDSPVLVDVSINDHLFGRFVASEYRPDLEAAGKGTGHHGLTVDFTGSQLSSAEGAVIISVAAAHMPGEPFCIFEVRQAVPGNTDLPEAYVQNLKRHYPRLIAEFHERGRLGWGVSPSIDFDGRAAAPIVQPIAGAGTLPRKLTISKYANYTRQRMRLEDQFDVAQASAEIDNYYKHYLEFYVRARAGQRSPLAAGEVAYFNELMVYGGQTFHLSRITWMFLLDDHALLGRLNLKSADSYIEVVYWWAINRSRDFWVEDCLVHPSYIQALSAVAPRWRSVGYPLSRFMELHFNRRVEWHFLNLEYEQDRSVYYTLLLLDAARQPTLLQYLPRLWIQKALEPRAGGGSLLELFLRQVVDPSPALDHLLHYKQSIKALGFDIDRRRSMTMTAEGHRVANVGLRPELAVVEPVSVQLIGPLHKASGLGQATRLSYDALVQHFPDCSAYDFDLDNPAPVGFNAKRPSSQLRKAKINLIHLNAESVPLVYAYLPDVFSDAYNIGYFFWELDTPASCHSLALELLDEVWVSSQYGVDQYTPFTSIPITKISMSYEDVPVPPRGRARAYLHSLLGYAEDCFVFFAAFDSFSFIQRKNPQAVVKAFIDAFPGDEKVRLVLKTHNRDFVHDPVQAKIWQLLDEASQTDPRIAIINETLPYEQLLLLKTGCDCYVSLHRSEGWGFGMIEAMHLGVAVLATGYSGNMEFCNPETAWLVGYEMRPVGPGDYIFVIPGQVWAEPDHADAVRQMRAVVHNPGERQARTARAKAFVDETFSPDVVAQRYADRLGQIAAAR